MHELGIARNVVSIACEHAKGQQVQKVRLEIGALSAIMPDAIRFCFDVCAKGTVVEGASLEIDEIAGRGKCADCGAESILEDHVWICSCGSTNVECISGMELRVKELEVA